MKEDEFGYFGFCPVCKGQDQFLMAKVEHWFTCHEHEFRWRWGGPLDSVWSLYDGQLLTSPPTFEQYEIIRPAYPDRFKRRMK